MIKKIIFSLCFLAVINATATAAEIRNLDGEEVVITITENGLRSDFLLAASETISVCANGCFVLFPSSTMIFLLGDENLEIENGDVVVK